MCVYIYSDVGTDVYPYACILIYIYIYICIYITLMVPPHSMYAQDFP